MTKSVSRVLVVVIALAAVLSLFSIAEGQYQGEDPVQGDRGSQFEPDPATTRTGFLGFGTSNPQPSSDPAAAVAAQNAATAVGGTGGGLAVTGSETDLPLAIGIGLLAVGGTAVVASRKRDA